MGEKGFVWDVNRELSMGKRKALEVYGVFFKNQRRLP